MGKAAVRSCEGQRLFSRQFNEHLITRDVFKSSRLKAEVTKELGGLCKWRYKYQCEELEGKVFKL